jgi:hypothetical protein
MKSEQFKELVKEMKQYLDTSKGEEALDVLLLEITKYYGSW